jgi:hypothetical protein
MPAQAGIQWLYRWKLLLRERDFDIHVFFRAVPRRGLLSFRGK